MPKASSYFSYTSSSCDLVSNKDFDFGRPLFRLQLQPHSLITNLFALPKTFYPYSGNSKNSRQSQHTKMRTSIAIAAGLVAVASATTYTATVTDDVTITSCGATVTNCPYKSTATVDPDQAWGDWDTTSVSTTSSVPVAPVSYSTATVDGSWSDWSSATSSIPVEPVSTVTSDGSWYDWSSVASTRSVSPITASTSTTTSLCPPYTATAPPAWFSLLPASALSSFSSAWTSGAPADWCYYTYSTVPAETSTKSTPVAPVSVTSTPAWSTSVASTPVAPASATTNAWSSYTR